MKKLPKPVPIHFTAETHRRLLHAATRMDVLPAELIRRAVERKLDEWEKDGGPSEKK